MGAEAPRGGGDPALHGRKGERRLVQPVASVLVGQDDAADAGAVDLAVGAAHARFEGQAAQVAGGDVVADRELA